MQRICEKHLTAQLVKTTAINGTPFLGDFAKLRKGTISFVMSDRLFFRLELGSQ